jgi:predicted DNA-binding transcriptional regulator AlpA
MRTAARPDMKLRRSSKRIERMSTGAEFSAPRVIAAPANTAKNLVHQVSPSPSEGRRGRRPSNGSLPMNITLPPTELLSPRQLAARWGLSEKTLERWRMLGTGPAFLKLGSRVLYSSAEVEAHERERTRRCTAGDSPSEVWA